MNSKSCNQPTGTKTRTTWSSDYCTTLNPSGPPGWPRNPYRPAWTSTGEDRDWTVPDIASGSSRCCECLSGTTSHCGSQSVASTSVTTTVRGFSASVSVPVPATATTTTVYQSCTG